jgi:hypothetical protein
MRANELVVGSDEHSFAVWFHVMERCELHGRKKRAHWGFVSFPRLLAYILCRTGLDSGEKETWSVFLCILKTQKAGLKRFFHLWAKTFGADV